MAAYLSFKDCVVMMGKKEKKQTKKPQDFPTFLVFKFL